MSAQLFEERLKAKLEKQMLDDTLALGAGVANTFEDYRRRCGVIEGLNAAVTAIQEVHAELYGPEKGEKKK